LIVAVFDVLTAFDVSTFFKDGADVDVFSFSSMFLTWAPESSEPEEMESVSLAMPSRDELVENQENDEK
jgi:hypothetical protein